jgi:uncharacterized protein
VDKIVTQLELPAEEATKVAAEAQKNQRQDEGFPFGAVIFMIFLFFFVFLPMIRSLNGGGRKHSRGGVGPVIIWGGGDWGGGGSSWGGGGGGGFGGFSGGGGSFGGGGSSGSWEQDAWPYTK